MVVGVHGLCGVSALKIAEKVTNSANETVLILRQRMEDARVADVPTKLDIVTCTSVKVGPSYRL